jgi:hypothetical protein
MPLYEPARHEALTSESWDASKVRTTLETWVRETVQAGSPRLFWPIHPSDDEAGGRPQKSLYVGAAGVIVALHRLQQDLGIEHTLDLAALADAAWSAYRAEPDVGRDRTRHDEKQAGKTEHVDPRIRIAVGSLHGTQHIGFRLHAFRQRQLSDPLVKSRASVGTELEPHVRTLAIVILVTLLSIWVIRLAERRRGAFYEQEHAQMIAHGQ